MFNSKGTCTVLPENSNLNDVIIFNGKTMAYTKKAWEELMSRPTLRERLHQHQIDETILGEKLAEYKNVIIKINSCCLIWSYEIRSHQPQCNQ